MLNNNREKALAAGGATFGLCVVAMLAGGLTWLTTAAGWLVFFAFVLSVVAGGVCWVLLNDAERVQWQKDRREVLDRLDDSTRTLRNAEDAHQRTKRELVDVRQQLTQANTDASTAKREFSNMKDRAAERGRTIDQLQTKISADNDQWRKQVSAVREAAYNMAVHIEGSANGLPDEWQEWGAELARDLRALAGAAGVENDARQVTIDDAIEYAGGPARTVCRAELPAAPTAGRPALDTLGLASLIAQVRANQQERRARLNNIYCAVEQGYELSRAINLAYEQGPAWVSDELIADEVRHIAEWRAKGGDTAKSTDRAI